MENKKKEKPTPRCCVCGKDAAVVVFKGRKMISCPNPEKCVGNLVTPIFRTKDEAISAWNAMVESYKYAGR